MSDRSHLSGRSPFAPAEIDRHHVASPDATVASAARHCWVADEASAPLLLLDEGSAPVDGLTGLQTRRLLEQRWTRARDGALRSRQGLAFLVADIDGLRQVNVQRGRAAGDAVLRVVAERLTACLGSDETLARGADDDFLVLLESLPDAAAARRTAAEIRAALNGIVKGRDRDDRIGISVGLAASFRPDSVTLEELIQDAYRSMDAEKRAKAARAAQGLQPD